MNINLSKVYELLSFKNSDCFLDFYVYDITFFDRHTAYRTLNGVWIYVNIQSLSFSLSFSYFPKVHDFLEMILGIFLSHSSSRVLRRKDLVERAKGIMLQ